jgi:carboxypeptidase T
MKKLLFFSLLLLSFSTQAQIWRPHYQNGIKNSQKAAPVEKYSRVRVDLQGHTIAEVKALGLECDHGHYRPHQFWESDISATDLQILQNSGFSCQVLIEDIRAHYVLQNQTHQPKSLLSTDCDNGLDINAPAGFSLGSMAGYFTYNELMTQLDSMAARYPNLISTRQAIDASTPTHEGRLLQWVRISDNPNQNENEPEALYTSLHHAREPLSASQLIFFMWYVLENYQNDPEIRYLVNNTELYFVPCVNPDGYVYNNNNSPNGGGMWRKNRRPNAGGSFGVDLNRNYGYAFAFDNTGSSPNANSDTYRGTAAFSEPETRNIKFFCEQHDFKLSLNYHSYGNLLVYPWAYNSAPTPDSTYFLEYAAFMTKENRYEVGSNMSTVGYNTNGDADDWFYGEQGTKNKILSMTPEAGSNQFGFYPPSSEIVNLCKKLVHQNLALPRLLLNYAQLRTLPSPVWTGLNNRVDYSIKKLGMGTQPFTVRLLPISNNISSVGADNVHNLAQFQSQNANIAVNLKSTTQQGETVELLIELDNGTVVQRDTIRHSLGTIASVFVDSANSMSSWANLGSNSFWGITSAAYYSPSTCITDSRTGNYANSVTSELVLTQQVDLSNAVDAKIAFWAKWAIENDYDYVQVMASSDGVNFSPLCGNYTNLGTADQDENQPLFDGEQLGWVREEMSLNDFVGFGNVSIKIRLVADNWVNADGFYLDDVEIRLMETSPIAVQKNPVQANLLAAAQPNPAKYSVFIPFNQEMSSEKANLIFYNALGQVVYNQTVAQNATGAVVELENWAEGVYYYQLQTNNSATLLQKLVVQR